MNASTRRRARSYRADSVSPSRNVLVAEDDSELRALIVRTLRDADFCVRAAADGRELLAMLTAASQREIEMPDVIVMDVRMPRAGGLEVLRALRLADWTQPVALMTAFADPELRERAAALGASVVLDKPFDADDLVAMVELLLLLPAEGTDPVTRH